ncbi:zinc-dependent alcohol dehydrogenase [Angustibacter aerolatus]
MPQMRRVVVHADRITVDQVEQPEPSATEALVRTTVSGVCGSDTHAAHGQHPFIELPYQPGHEVVGVVEAVGADVTAVQVGQRVTVEPTLVCGHCKSCTTGNENICENLEFFGCNWPQGGMADRFTVDAARLHVVPDDLDDTAAALIEPLSTPVHAIRLAGGVEGRTVAILGAGTIGLLVLAAARHQGARRIVVTDVLPAKRERALRMGADAAVDAASSTVVSDVRHELGESADVVLDCVAIQRTVDQAIQLADKGGTVVVVGVPVGDVTIPLPIVQDHQIRIQGAATYLPEDYATSIAILQAGGVPVDEVVTATLPLDDVAEAFALSGTADQVKVLVRP